MSQNTLPIKTSEKLAIFRRCFSGRPDCYGTYDLASGWVETVKKPVTDQVLLNHLRGVQPYGVFLLQGDRTRAAVADFDHEDPQPPFQFVMRARHYSITSLVERSKSKGWHVWVFFPADGVTARKARRTMRIILADIEMPVTEVFPKHDKLDDSTQFGNFINAPLFGRLVPQGRTVFVSPNDPFRPYPNQWSVLEHVPRISESLLDEILDINGADCAEAAPARVSGQAAGETTKPSFGLPPCAQKMLAEGVTDLQRQSCFRLAVQLRKAGLPQYAVIACLDEWAGRNRPGSGKTIVTHAEIVSQTGWAYAKGYRGCGCEDEAVKPFCSAACTLRNRLYSGHPGSEDEQAVGHQNARMSNDKQ